MQFKIGVFGTGHVAKKDYKKYSAIIEKAKILGRTIVERGGLVITGACKGFPGFAAEVAIEAGGRIIGISPAKNLEDHIGQGLAFGKGYDLIFTGLGNFGRDPINIRTCDATLFIGGRIGTISEFLITLEEYKGNKVIGVLRNSGTAVDKHIIPLIKESAEKIKAQIIISNDPKTLVRRCFRLLNEHDDDDA